MQDNGIASSDVLHSMEVDWYERNLHFKPVVVVQYIFFEMQKTERVIHQ